MTNPCPLRSRAPVNLMMPFHLFGYSSGKKKRKGKLMTVQFILRLRRTVIPAGRQLASTAFPFKFRAYCWVCDDSFHQCKSELWTYDEHSATAMSHAWMKSHTMRNSDTLLLRHELWLISKQTNTTSRVLSFEQRLRNRVVFGLWTGSGFSATRKNYPHSCFLLFLPKRQDTRTALAKGIFPISPRASVLC